MTSPNWISPRTGHDWTDPDVQRVVDWLKSFVPTSTMEARLDQARANLLQARQRWSEGELADAYDPTDTAAWFILQAQTFATDRELWVPDECARIVPFLSRLGKEFATIRSIAGAEERAARLMTTDRRQPESGIFELLVALAYKRRGWTTVEFIPEEPGRRRTPDLHVAQPRRRWAVECKRLMPSQYAKHERRTGLALADPLHVLSLELGRSLIIEVVYKIELKDVPADYLVQKVREAVTGRSYRAWNDDVTAGHVRDVDWTLAHNVLAHDDIYFGSSRMIELIVGDYPHNADHSFRARWRPSRRRPFFADTVYQASVVRWWSASDEAQTYKARHFRSTLAKGEGQLPSDRPGVIHIGIESQSGNQVDGWRHFRNFMEARDFSPTTSRLRWVYASYFVPEATTRQDEAWAITETSVPYPIGSHRTAWPLPGHMLVLPENETREGVHWDGRG